MREDIYSYCGGGLQVSVSCLIQFVTVMGLLFGFNELILFIEKDFKVGMGLLDFITSLATFWPMAMAPLSIWVQSKIGTLSTLFIGLIISSIALLASSLAPNVTILLLTHGILFGTGCTFLLNPQYVTLDEYFPYGHPRHVLATSIVTCAYPLAVLIFNPLSYLILSNVGWRWTLVIYIGLLNLAFLLTSIPFAVKFRNATEIENNHQEIVEINCNVLLKRKIIIGGIWFLGSLSKSMAYYTPGIILVKHMTTLGIKQSTAANGMIITSFFELITRTLTSILGVKMKGRFVLIYAICCLALSLIAGLWSLAETFTSIMICSAISGLIGGPILAAIFSACGEVLGKEYNTMMFSVVRCAIGFGILLGPTFSGIIYDHTGSYVKSFYLASGFFFVAFILYSLTWILNYFKPRIIFGSLDETIPLTTK